MKNKYTILFLLFVIFFGCTKKGKGSKDLASPEDSLAIYLSLANDDDLPFESKQKYNKKAFDVIVSQEDDSLTRVNLFKVANRYYNMNDW